MKPACELRAACESPHSAGDRFQLLGDLADSKEVAIGMEIFVIRGKAFFPQYLRLREALDKRRSERSVAEARVAKA